MIELWLEYSKELQEAAPYMGEGGCGIGLILIGLTIFAIGGVVYYFSHQDYPN